MAYGISSALEYPAAFWIVAGGGERGDHCKADGRRGRKGPFFLPSVRCKPELDVWKFAHFLRESLERVSDLAASRSLARVQLLS